MKRILTPCQENDPELWFSTIVEDKETAKSHCARCPDQAGCLAGALQRDEQYGIWAGVDRSPKEEIA